MPASDRPAPGTYVEVTETYADGTTIRTAGLVSAWHGGDHADHLIHIGKGNFPAVWTLDGTNTFGRPGRLMPTRVTVIVGSLPAAAPKGPES